MESWGCRFTARRLGSCARQVDTGLMRAGLTMMEVVAASRGLCGTHGARQPQELAHETRFTDIPQPGVDAGWAESRAGQGGLLPPRYSPRAVDARKNYTSAIAPTRGLHLPARPRDLDVAETQAGAPCLLLYLSLKYPCI